MKTKIQLFVALAVIVAAAYWAFISVSPLNYTGSNIMFPIGSGKAVVTNPGSEAIPIELRSGERIASFRAVSPEIGLAQSAKREGTGRNAFYTLTFDLPPGQTTVSLTSGSGVQMISRSETRITAVVTPIAEGTMRWILTAAGVVILWALYYMSRVTEHRWIGSLRNRLSGGNMQPKQTTT